MSIDSKRTYDVAVIGGGPAGMMAAGTAASRGLSVLLIEKNPTLGKKLLITGGGRCNVTNMLPDIRTLAERYGDKGKFLLSPLSRFGVNETVHFFESRGMKIKVEAENRAFPESNSAESVHDVLTSYLKEGNVHIEYNAHVKGFEISNGKITGVKVGNNIVHAKSYVLSTGGKSRPETGSTGDGFVWLKEIGHTVIDSNPALVPIKINDEWVKELQGLPLSDIKITVFQGNDMHYKDTGRILFTHFGISGPLVLNMSSEIQELHKYGDVTLSLDLFPTLNHNELDLKLQELWKTEQNKKFKNSLSRLVPSKLAPVLVRLSGIDPELFVNKVSRVDRLKIIKLIKDMKMTVSGFLGNEKAIVTSGGVALEEVDFKTMQSLKFTNLFIAGDMLNFNRPSGGFSLQICWTTGYIAGLSA